jgi:hypothetical protein
MQALSAENGCSAAWKATASDSLKIAPALVLNYRDTRTDLSQNANRIEQNDMKEHYSCKN